MVEFKAPAGRLTQPSGLCNIRSMCKHYVHTEGIIHLHGGCGRRRRRCLMTQIESDSTPPFVHYSVTVLEVATH